MLSHLEDEDDRLSGLVNYVGEFGGFPVYENYTAEYFPSGEQKFELSEGRAGKKPGSSFLWSILL